MAKLPSDVSIKTRNTSLDTAEIASYEERGYTKAQALVLARAHYLINNPPKSGDKPQNASDQSNTHMGKPK
jgi:hypothetical protein